MNRMHNLLMSAGFFALAWLATRLIGTMDDIAEPHE